MEIYYHYILFIIDIKTINPLMEFIRDYLHYNINALQDQS